MIDRTNPLPAALLDRYLTGECTPDEVDTVRTWLTQHPKHERAMTVFQAIGFESGVSESDPRWETSTLAAAWERFKRRSLTDRETLDFSNVRGQQKVETAILAGLSLMQTPSTSESAWLRNRIVFGLAVVTTVVGVLALSSMVGLQNRMSFTHSSAVRRTFTTTVGQRATIYLTDGSRVMLAPNSSLEVPSDFGRRARAVTLAGEAYFDVTTSARVPFSVRAGNVRTDVLGTSFVVRRYKDDEYTRVAVTTGRVLVMAVADKGSADRYPTVVLAAGMVGDVTDTTALAMAVPDVSVYTGWTLGQLAFHRTPVPQALALLERWYGYQFRITDSALLQRDLTATLDANDTASMLLMLETVLGVTSTLDGSVITLQPRRTSGAPSRDTVRGSAFYPFQKEVGQ